MRILVLHSRYLSGSISGENRVVDEEVSLLRQAGHEVHVLAPEPDRFLGARLAVRTLTSAKVGRSVYDRVRADGIQVVHCHNLYPALGPGVIAAASNAGAATVLTLHNYRLMCVAGTFFRDGRVCTDCLGRPHWPGVLHACYRGSRSQSAVLATSLVAARRSGVFAAVDRFLAVSRFVREKHVEAGYPAQRILVKPNIVPAQDQRRGPGSYFLILSRLSSEKGVAGFARIWEEDLGELRIFGDGPERAVIERLAGARGVHYEGAATPDEVPGLLAGARAVIVPSAGYEGQSRVVLEAYAAGVPVIVSRIGGLPESVVDGETGFTVPTGEPEAWRRAIRLFGDDQVSLRFGEAAHAHWRASFSPERGLAMLEAGHAEALEERARRSGAS